MHEKHRKINFIKIAFVSISINRDMVLKWKLGQLVRTDHHPLKRISFSSTHCRSKVVISLSRDIVHKLKNSLLQEKKETVYTFLPFRHYSTSFCFLLISFLRGLFFHIFPISLCKTWDLGWVNFWPHKHNSYQTKCQGYRPHRFRQEDFYVFPISLYKTCDPWGRPCLAPGA